MTQTPDALARDWFESVWNKQDESAIDRLLHPEALAHGPGAQPIRGPEQFKIFSRLFKTAFGNMRIQVERTVAQGDIVVALCHVTGTHVGDSLGGPATGKDVDFRGTTTFRVSDGKIVEGWNTFDFLTMYQQLGWIANPVEPRTR
jgi:steroid delta-isomerase-like uncharacterized protein